MSNCFTITHDNYDINSNILDVLLIKDFKIQVYILQFFY